ncbi:hypothetical protein HZS_2554, partial [Henneguya salminicola]
EEVQQPHFHRYNFSYSFLCLIVTIHCLAISECIPCVDTLLSGKDITVDFEICFINSVKEKEFSAASVFDAIFT